MLERCESVTINIDSEKKEKIALKYKIMDGNIYAYNMFLPIENRKMLKVFSINGVNVSDIIDNIKEEELYDINALKKYGIDTTNEYVLELVDFFSIVKFDVLNLESVNKIFCKKHELNPKINTEQNKIESTGTIIDNPMLDYASTNFKVLLKILKSDCSSDADKEIIDKLAVATKTVNDDYINVENNLDMLYLSSQLLMMIEEKITYIPENIIYTCFENKPRIRYIVMPSDCMLADGKINYVRLVTLIRNAIAHSSYRVSESGMVEFYHKDNNGVIDMQIVMPKEDIKYLFYRLYEYKYLQGSFPCIYSETIINTPNPLNYDFIYDYLKNLDIYDISSYELKEVDDNYLWTDLYHFNTHTFLLSPEQRFNSTIQKYLTDDCKLVKFKLSEEEVKYILDNIREFGSDYFFNLGSSAQIDVINKLIKKRFNSKYYLISNIDKILETNYETNDSLTERASDYINLKCKVELTITALLNNILVFCYNNNNANIDAKNLRFPRSVYIDYMNSCINEFYDVLEENSINTTVDSTYLTTTTDIEEILHDVPSPSRDLKRKLKRIKKEIYGAGMVVSGYSSEENYNNINKKILNHMRNCLAHGRLRIDDINTNNVKMTKLEFCNLYKGKERFKTTISLGSLLTTINQPEFLETMLNTNINFNSNKL